MKRIIALASLALLCVAAQYPGVGQNSVDSRLSRDTVLRDELAPQPSKVIGTICPLFHDGEASFYTHAVALADSIRNGLGSFSGASYAGADLQFTTLIMATQTGVGSQMDSLTLQAIDGNTSYEIGSHGPDSERLGAFGVDNTGSRVSAFGVTGMSEAFVDSVLSGYQERARQIGIRPFKTHAPANWKYQGGTERLFLKHGYTSQITLGVPVLHTYTTEVNGLSAMLRNTDHFVPALWGRGGNVSFAGGFHTIGEPLNRFDIGSVSWGRTNNAGGVGDTLVAGPQTGTPIGVSDSVKVATDMAAWYGDGFAIAFHRVIDDDADITQNTDIRYDRFREICIYWAQGISEGWLQVLTASRFADWIAGYRYGELSTCSSLSFRTLDQNAGGQAHHGAGGQITPMGMMPPMGSLTMYVSSGDTLRDATALGTGGVWKIINATADKDTISLSNTDPDSLTHGMSGVTENVLVSRCTTTETINDLRFLFRTTAVGSRHKFVRLAVQIMPTGFNLGLNNDVHADLRATCWEENWQDVNNYGSQVQYQIMPQATGSWGTAPVLTRDLMASRVRPRFAYQTQDSTAYVLSGVAADTTASGDLVLERPLRSSNTGWLQRLFGPGLMPVQSYSLTGTSDYRIPFGDPVGTGADDADWNDNWQPLNDINRPFNCYFYLKIDPWTDYYYVVLNVQNSGAPFSANQALVVTNVSLVGI